MGALLCNLIFSTTMEAHKEPTHQYIIREAYSLVKKHLGRSIPEFDTYILGSDSLGREGQFDDHRVHPWSYSTVCGGAWNEDHHDPIQFMHEVEVLFRKGMFTSINHFWDPDQEGNGFNNRFELHLPWNPWPTGIFEWNACSLARTYASDVEHDLMAYKKAMIYLSSKAYTPRLHESFMITQGQKEYNSPGYFQASLIDWYKGDFIYDDADIESRKKDIIYSILGRVTHLLGDMSIPAHVKCDEHGLWHDPYEDAMNYVEWDGNKESPCIDAEKNIPASGSRVEYWNHDKIFCEKGSVVLPSCSQFRENPYWTFFYTTAQIADHFASNRFNGDDQYLPVGEIHSIITSSNKGPTHTNFVDGHPLLSGYLRNDEDINAIRDMTFPYVIRATAGLLFHIALEYSLINTAHQQCPNNLLVRDGILSAPHYIFESSDSIIMGDQKKPLCITSNVNIVNIRAGHIIRFNPGMHAQSGATVHALNTKCTACYDDTPGFVQTDDHDSYSSSTLEYKVLYAWDNNEDTKSSCCISDPVSSIRCMDDKGLLVFESKKKTVMVESDVMKWIQTQKRGIYSMHIEYVHGKKEMKIIARL